MALKKSALAINENGTTTTTSTGVSSSISTTASSSLFSSPTQSLSPINIKTQNNKHQIPSSTTQFGPLSPIKPITSSLSTKDIVIQLRQLAQDPSQQIHLINNTQCLKTLCDTLLITNNNNNNNTETPIIALQTLQLLALNPNYRNTLRSIPHLLQRIDSLTISNIQRIQIIAKHLKETINSKIPLNKYQQYQPRPLHKLCFTIINLNTEQDRDEIHTIGIKIKGIISITVDMQTHIVTFYSSRDNVKKSLVQSLRTKGFQVQTDDEKELFDDATSMHSGVSNFTDHNRGQLSSLRQIADNNNHKTSSIIQGRYNNNNNNDQDDNESNNNSLLSLNASLLKPNSQSIISGPQYVEPARFSRTGITKYRPNNTAMSLAQRLEFERKIEQEQRKKQQQTQSFLTKVISYIW